MEFWVLLVIVVVVALVITLIFNPSAIGLGKQVVVEPEKLNLGGLTLEALAYYSGYDWSKPVVFAVKGKIYDVTSSFEVYGPCKPMHVYAGKEVARAIAKASLSIDDVGPGPLKDLSPEEEARLAEEIARLDAAYPAVGHVVPMLELTAAELSQHDGSDTSRPLYLAIQGTVYDISKGQQFYGPGGVYPFAGHEVARAFALMSTELTDCTSNLEGVSRTELENLREWTAKFNSKYPIVGNLAREKKEQ